MPPDSILDSLETEQHRLPAQDQRPGGALDHLRVDPEVRVSPAGLEPAERVRVANPGRRVHGSCQAPRDRLAHQALEEGRG